MTQLSQISADFGFLDATSRWGSLLECKTQGQTVCTVQYMRSNTQQWIIKQL